MRAQWHHDHKIHDMRKHARGKYQEEESFVFHQGRKGNPITLTKCEGINFIYVKFRLKNYNKGLITL